MSSCQLHRSPPSLLYSCNLPPAPFASDGLPVFVRPGEKFIVEPKGPPDDPSTFVSLKIKQKGKRGAGPGWGK